MSVELFDENPIKVIDISKGSVNPLTVNTLENQEAHDYKDESDCGENMYGINVLETMDTVYMEEDVLDDLTAIIALCDTHDASYFRLIK